MVKIGKLESLLSHIPSARRQKLINAILNEAYHPPQMVSLPFELVTRLESPPRLPQQQQIPLSN